MWPCHACAPVFNAPQQSIGLERWLKDLAGVIQSYAKTHKVPVKGLGVARLEE